MDCLFGGDFVNIIEALGIYDTIVDQLETKLPTLLFLLPNMNPTGDLQWEGEVAPVRLRLDIKNVWIDRTVDTPEVVVNLTQTIGINDEEPLDLRFSAEYFERWLHVR